MSLAPASTAPPPLRPAAEREINARSHEGTLLWRTAQQEMPMPAPVLTTDVAMRVTGVILRATVRQEFANPSSE